MTQILFQEFAISAIMLVFCVVIHGLGLFSLNKALRSEASEERMRRMTALSFRGAAFTLGIVLALVAIHAIEIWSYALIFLALDAVKNLEEALYYSSISYSTVGYNDTHIVPEWRLLGAFESILGMILLGWSTAFFIRMLSRIEAH